MKGYLKIAIALVAAAVAFPAGAGAISYPGAVRAPELEARLPTPVSVYCTQNTSYSFAMIDDRELYLGEQECATLRNQPSSMGFWGAAEVLYHEWWHVAFHEIDERLTECGTDSMLRWALRHFWGYTRAQAQEAYRQATLWSPYAPLPCAPNNIDPVQL